MPCGARIKCPQLKNLPKPPTSLSSVNFRHTTPGSGMVLVTKYKPQPTSELFDPTYPGARLSLNQRTSLAPRWVSPHLVLYAFPKAFLSKPDVPYHEPYAPRPYPAPTTRRPEQRTADMSMQFIMLNSRVVLRAIVRTKIKRRLREIVRLIVTRGAAVEESRDRVPKLVFRAEDVGADKWIVPDWTYIALPTTAMFRMPFTKQLELMRQALRLLHRRIPEVERGLRHGAGPNPTLNVQSLLGASTTVSKSKSLPGLGKGKSPSRRVVREMAPEAKRGPKRLSTALQTVQDP